MGCFSTLLTSLSPWLLQGLALQSQSILSTLSGDGKVGFSPTDRLGREAERLGLRSGQRRPGGRETWVSLGLIALAGIAWARADPACAFQMLLMELRQEAPLPREMPPTATGHAAQSQLWWNCPMAASVTAPRCSWKPVFLPGGHTDALR